MISHIQRGVYCREIRKSYPHHQVNRRRRETHPLPFLGGYPKGTMHSDRRRDYNNTFINFNSIIREKNSYYFIFTRQKQRKKRRRNIVKVGDSKQRQFYLRFMFLCLYHSMFQC